MKKKKTLIICIVAILTLICITVGISLAFFNYAGKGTTDNTLETGSITFLYTETSNAGRGIAIEDAFPLSDTEGKALTGEGNVFDFNISATKSGHNKRIDYEITARKSDDSTLSEDVVVMYLTKVNGVNEKEILLDKYSNLADTEKVSGYNEKTLYKTAVYVADDTYSQDYKLRMWITNDGTFEQEDMGKTFKVNVNVYADAKVVEQGQIAFENNTLIDNLKVENSTINPVENEDYKYDAILPYDTTEANIIIETVNPNATVDIKNVTSNYAYTNIISKVSTTRKLEGLVNGDNYFDITVTSENGKVEDEYILKVEVKDKTPPELDVTNTAKSLNSITITYNTSDSDTGVKEVICEYGPTKEYGNSVVCSNGVCVLNGLGLGTEYYYRIISRNISGTEKIIENSLKTDSCTAGYYGANGTSSCSKCPTGYISEAGSQNINSCYVSLTAGQGKTANGTATSCAAGTYYGSARTAYYGTAYNCTTCEAGYYCTGGSARSSCGTGKSSSVGATAASSCYSLCAYVPGQTWNFDYTGGIQSFTVPTGCEGLYKLEVWGASSSGAGGYSMGYKYFKNQPKLYIVCGGRPYNGGGYGNVGPDPYDVGDTGGGATHIAFVSGTLASIGYNSFVTQGNGLIVAGGGGGGGGQDHGNHQTELYQYGGSGGGTAGTRGQGGGNPGTQTSGYVFGQGGYGSSYNAGGGGGGLYGGAGGGSNPSGGSGGSGYIGGVPTLTFKGTTYSPSTTTGGNSGNGRAKITLIQLD